MDYILALYNVIFNNDEEGDKRQTFVIARKAKLFRNRVNVIY